MEEDKRRGPTEARPSHDEKGCSAPVGNAVRWPEATRGRGGGNGGSRSKHTVIPSRAW